VTAVADSRSHKRHKRRVSQAPSVPGPEHITPVAGAKTDELELSGMVAVEIGRRLTLVTLAMTVVAACWMAAALLPSAIYALRGDEPTEVDAGRLTNELGNRWVHLRGAVETEGIEYRRPLDPDTFRLARMEAPPNLWVEVRIPSDLDPAHYVPPSSFVGRLVKLENAGLRHAAVAPTVARVTGITVPKDAWLLVDGEAPAGTRWVLGVVAMLVGFAAFGLWGLVHLSRPVRS
jgi:hypothetical protein